jgi:hypothetical protein
LEHSSRGRAKKCAKGTRTRQKRAGSLLESREDEREIRRAVAGFRAYQVAGLAAFARWLVGDGVS